MTSPRNTNTKHRYFYADTLAAAWMAKQFGMKFDGISVSFTERSRGLPCIFEVYEISEQNKKANGVVIHPDSLHLLEPQEGDVVEHDGIEFGLVIGRDEKECAVQYCEDSDGKTLCCTVPVDEITIIQRDGKPFHWPEREAV